MTTNTPAADLCRTCGQEPAGADGIGAACRARRAAALAAMAAATKAAEAAKAAAQAKPKPGKPSKAKAEAQAAADHTGATLRRLIGPPQTSPATPVVPLPAGELIAEFERMEREAADPPPKIVRVRVRVGGLVPPRVVTCIQCPREKPFPADPDNTPSRCGACVRKNKAAVRNFTSGG